MMTTEEKVALWCGFDEQTKAELENVTNQKELEDRFYKELEFGTGGLRGIMGAGTNRMNRYTVGRATFGLCNYLLDNFGDKSSVVIAYDSRNNSKLFAEISAGIFAKMGISAYLFSYIVPVPILSFACRKLKTTAGVMITASHNPKEYNGYKVYDGSGCQICTDDAKSVLSYINAITDFSAIPFSDSTNDVEFIGDEILNDFYDSLNETFPFEVKSNIKIVYTPLHGTGNIPVRKMTEDLDVVVVKEQEIPDGNFSTVRSPNPEEPDALNLAISKAKAIGADLVLGTDPDCDRVGIAVKNNNDDYVLLTGNQTGALLINYLLSEKIKPISEKSTVVKTIVTSELGAEIARMYGLKIVDTLTGFKYIGNKMNQYESSDENEFFFGYEESYGYLAHEHSRDKDGVSSAMLICRMAAHYYNQGKNLCEVLDEIYVEYGYYCDKLCSFTLKGKEGTEKIRKLMENFRSNGTSIFNAQTVIDYSKGINDLPKENVLKFILSDGSWIAVRPSGTEPKIKVYFSMLGKNQSDAEQKYLKFKATVENLVK